MKVDRWYASEAGWSKWGKIVPPFHAHGLFFFFMFDLSWEGLQGLLHCTRWPYGCNNTHDTRSMWTPKDLDCAHCV